MEEEPWYLSHPIKSPRDIADYLEDYLHANGQVDNKKRVYAWVRIDDLDQWCALSYAEKSTIQKTLHNRVKARRGIDDRVYVYKQVESYPPPGKRYPHKYFEYWIGLSKTPPSVYLSRVRDFERAQERKTKVL